MSARGFRSNQTEARRTPEYARRVDDSERLRRAIYGDEPLSSEEVTDTLRFLKDDMLGHNVPWLRSLGERVPKGDHGMSVEDQARLIAIAVDLAGVCGLLLTDYLSRRAS